MTKKMCKEKAGGCAAGKMRSAPVESWLSDVRAALLRLRKMKSWEHRGEKWGTDRALKCAGWLVTAGRVIPHHVWDGHPKGTGEWGILELTDHNQVPTVLTMTMREWRASFARPGTDEKNGRCWSWSGALAILISWLARSGNGGYNICVVYCYSSRTLRKHRWWTDLVPQL